VNFGLLCASLPILPIFYQHLSRPKNKSASSTSTYYRLDTLNSANASGVERAKLNQADKAQAERTVNPASQRNKSEISRGPEGLSVSVMGGADRNEENAASWEGDGILKTVDVEQHRVSVPEQAVLPITHMYASPSKD